MLLLPSAKLTMGASIPFVYGLQELAEVQVKVLPLNLIAVVLTALLLKFTHPQQGCDGFNHNLAARRFLDW